MNAVDNLQWSPLHFACAAGQVDIARQLLDAGAGLDARSVTAATPLVEAVHSARPNVVQMLLNRGASTDCTTHAGRLWVL